MYTELKPDIIIKNISDSLIECKIIGIFNGRMEFGPRSLGGRSIIADPRNKNMQKMLNLKIKFRESFRPFAPSILKEDLNEWFELNYESPYMLFVSKILKKHQIKSKSSSQKLFGIKKLNQIRSNVPAVTHIDYSARIQTVTKNFNSFFYKILKSFKKKTNCPILVNTSFNIRGEPIVCTPEDAFKCFMGTEIDILVIENFYLEKKLQKINKNVNYRHEYKLD